MKNYQLVLFAMISACALSDTWAQAPGSSNTPLPTRNVQEATSSTGTILRKTIRWNSKIPLDKTYGELTEEQKAVLHAEYESLKPGDEPPFPAKGIKPIFNAIKNAQRTLQARGALDMAVTVGPDGKAIKVDDFSSLRRGQMTDLAQQVLLLTTYKPAICAGTPCTMQFRFTQLLNGG